MTSRRTRWTLFYLGEHRPRRLQTFAYFNLSIVNMRQHLSQIARVDKRPADRAIAELIGFGFGGAVRIEARMVRHLGHSSSVSKLNPWRSTTLPFRVIGT
jgi:hypothetical protein